LQSSGWLAHPPNAKPNIRIRAFRVISDIPLCVAQRAARLLFKRTHLGQPVETLAACLARAASTPAQVRACLRWRPRLYFPSLAVPSGEPRCPEASCPSRKEPPNDGI